jgi:RNA recognition motif-containing protein
LYTTERDLREVFSGYGPLSGVNVVYDQRTGRSRGFAFVYFERIDDSKEASFLNFHFEKLFVILNRVELLSVTNSHFRKQNSNQTQTQPLTVTVRMATVSQVLFYF